MSSSEGNLYIDDLFKSSRNVSVSFRPSRNYREIRKSTSFVT